MQAMVAATLGLGASASQRLAARAEPSRGIDAALNEAFGICGKVALLTDTGASGSREIALLLARAGAVVILGDRDTPQSRGIVAAVTAAGRSAWLVPTDVADEASVAALFAKVAQRHARLDILVNCGGLYLNQPLVQTTTAQWDEIQSANLRANFLCMRQALKAMLGTRTGGRIVNVSTVGATRPVLMGNGAYAAARAGVTLLGESAALDHANDGILVNTVFVGSIPGKVPFHPDTEGAVRAGREITGPLRGGPERQPLGVGRMTDVAAAVLYLVGPSGSYLTGQSIVLDGGFLLS